MLFGYICLLVLIILFWRISGKWEWEPPARLSAKLAAIGAGQGIGECGAETVEIHFAELDYGQLEKEIYLRKKAGRWLKTDYLLDLNIRFSNWAVDHEEKTKIKRRLEKRFHGLNVHFLPKEQERENASVYGN